MRFLSEASFAALQNAESDLLLERERNQRLTKAYRILERRHQELLLLIGLKGLAVEIKPAIPAQPARMILKNIK